MPSKLVLSLEYLCKVRSERFNIFAHSFCVKGTMAAIFSNFLYGKSKTIGVFFIGLYSTTGSSTFDTFSEVVEYFLCFTFLAINVICLTKVRHLSQYSNLFFCC